MENYLILVYIAVKAQKTVNKAQENYKIVLEVLKADTEIVKDNDLVTGIKTLLDTAFIALQVNRESV